MMKKLITAALFMLLSVGIKAQNEVGTISIRPVAGITISNLTDLEDNKSKVGLVSGAEFSYTVHPVVDVEAGLLYATQGSKWSPEIGDSKFSLEYINLPLTASAQLWRGLRIRSGVQFGFNVRSKGEYGNNDEIDFKDETKKVDIAIPFGLSYEYEGFVLDARYNLGITRAFKDDMQTKAKNSVFYITLGYKIPL